MADENITIEEPQDTEIPNVPGGNGDSGNETPDVITAEEKASAVKLLFALVFEHIVPWGQPDGDTGLSSRLKLQRNFEKIKAWIDASPTYFLSRLYDDIAYGHITFNKGLTAKGYLDELLTERPGLEVKGDSTFTGNLSSPEFISNFIGGKGWALQKKEFVNAAGVTEYKYVLEVDGLTARETVRVYALIASQLLGENDNRIFTAMMEVHHYDPETGRVWLNTNMGKLYNTLRPGDHIMVQQYQPGNDVASGGTGYITKHYELIVNEVGTGGATDENGDRLDWVTISNFTPGVSQEGTAEELIAKGDTFCRVDSLTDPERKGIIQTITVGTNAPYMDILYGLKTDPDHALKARLGNLQGIRTDDFGWLQNFGIYTNNIYATGQFRNSQTGESLTAKISTTKEQHASIYKETTYDISEDDNHVSNGFFVRELEKWTPCDTSGTDIATQGTTGLFNSGGTPLMVNGQLISVGAKQQAVLTEYDGVPMLKLYGAGVKQSFADMKVNTTHKELTTEQGSETQDVSDTLYMGIRILPVTEGTLRVDFMKDGAQTVGWQSIVSNIGNWMTIQAHDAPQSPWDFTGTGKMVVSYTGQCLIRFVALTNDPVESLKVDFYTKVTQTARLWRVEADATYSTRTEHAELSVRVGQIGTEVTNNKQASDLAKQQIENRLGIIEMFDNNTATWMTQTDQRFAFWAGNFDANGNVKDLAQLRIDVNEISTTVGTLATTAALNAYVESLQNSIQGVRSSVNNNASAIHTMQDSINIVTANFNDDGTVKTSSRLSTYISGRTSFLDGAADVVRFYFTNAWEVYHRDNSTDPPTDTKVMGLDASGVPWFKGNIDSSTIINNVEMGNGIYKFRFSPLGDNGAQLLGYKEVNNQEVNMLSLGFTDVSIPQRVIDGINFHASSSFSSSTLKLRSIRGNNEYDSFFRSGDISLGGASSIRMTSISIPELWMKNGDIELGLGVWDNKMFIGCNKWPGKEQLVPVGYVYVDGDGYVKVKGYDQGIRVTN